MRTGIFLLSGNGKMWFGSPGPRKNHNGNGTWHKLIFLAQYHSSRSQKRFWLLVDPFSTYNFFHHFNTLFLLLLFLNKIYILQLDSPARFFNAATIYGHANKQMTTHCTVLHYWTIPAFIALPSPRPALSCPALQCSVVKCCPLYYTTLRPASLAYPHVIH